MPDSHRTILVKKLGIEAAENLSPSGVGLDGCSGDGIHCQHVIDARGCHSKWYHGRSIVGRLPRLLRRLRAGNTASSGILFFLLESLVHLAQGLYNRVVGNELLKVEPQFSSQIDRKSRWRDAVGGQLLHQLVDCSAAGVYLPTHVLLFSDTLEEG